MSESVNRFERFRQEHARLHDPALVRGAVEFAPVELSEIAPAADRRSAKKKKKRHGLKGGRASAKENTSQAPAEPLEDERLLPAAFIRRLRQRSHGAAAPTQEGADDKTPARTAQGEPRIEVEPQSVACSLSLFDEQSFVLDAPAAQKVELAWCEELAQDGRHTSATPALNASRASATSYREVHRVVMDHKQGDQFETRIGVPDGSYLFAFAVDGYMRPDVRQARRVLLTTNGLFAPLMLARRQRTLLLTNTSAAEERVMLEASVPWIMPEQTQFVVPAHGSIKLKIGFDLAAMPAELNQGLLHLSVEREERRVAAGVVHFAAQVEVGGALPAFSFTPREFGEVKQGIDEPRLAVEIIACGRGPLNGMISLPHSGELADFRLNADGGSDAAHFAHTFQIESANLPQPQPHHTEATLKVMLITDSFLANYRLCRAEIPYRLVHLKKSLPALSFGTVRAHGTKSMRLEVERSDGREIELSVALPESAASYLEAYAARADAYVFRLDTSALPPGTNISETVELIDRRSGLRDQIKVLATVARNGDEPVRAAVNSSA
ncbi:MAG TPA: hypothetical protein VF544_24115 [Pyrinomonadaceae bacterium]|jgi:hypothetical protein